MKLLGIIIASLLCNITYSQSPPPPGVGNSPISSAVSAIPLHYQVRSVGFFYPDPIFVTWFPLKDNLEKAQRDQILSHNQHNISEQSHVGMKTYSKDNAINYADMIFHRNDNKSIVEEKPIYYRLQRCQQVTRQPDLGFDKPGYYTSEYVDIAATTCTMLVDFDVEPGIHYTYRIIAVYPKCIKVSDKTSTSASRYWGRQIMVYSHILSESPWNAVRNSALVSSYCSSPWFFQMMNLVKDQHSLRDLTSGLVRSKINSTIKIDQPRPKGDNNNKESAADNIKYRRYSVSLRHPETPHLDLQSGKKFGLLGLPITQGKDSCVYDEKQSDKEAHDNVIEPLMLFTIMRDKAMQGYNQCIQKKNNCESWAIACRIWGYWELARQLLISASIFQDLANDYYMLSKMSDQEAIRLAEQHIGPAYNTGLENITKDMKVLTPHIGDMHADEFAKRYFDTYALNRIGGVAIKSDGAVYYIKPDIKLLPVNMDLMRTNLAVWSRTHENNTYDITTAKY